jgi:thymidylate synthase
MGLGWLLRGLYLHPAIRNLIICGNDLSLTGEALLALWKEGLNNDNLILGLGWEIYPEMDQESVETLRKYVQVWDWRNKSLEEIGRAIDDIPYLAPEMEPRSFPPLIIPQRTAFPSRKTSFPLFADEVGDAWLQLLNLIMFCGTVKGTRKGDRLTEVLNTMVTIKLSDEEEPLSPCFDFSLNEFETYYQQFMSPSCPEGVNYTYGERLQNYKWFNQATGKIEPVNQVERAISRLRKSHDTKRATMVLLGPTDLDVLDDAPCVVLVTFNIVDERLYGTYVIRSNDIYNAWPFNALSLARLQREIAQQVGLPADSATLISHSAHIYERDWDKAFAKLDKWFKRPLPFQPDLGGSFSFAIENGMVKAQLVSPAGDKVLWQQESPNPVNLIRHIVDTMPWLTAQHIRYLGGEAAKLAQALKDGTPYKQG